MHEIITLPNGVRVVTERLPAIRSAAIGIWVGTGSRQEGKAEGGAAHFIEHMLFKGTETRSAADIARETDAIGGQINAFTTKECTCYYARVLDNHVAQVFDILWDMVQNSKFDQKDVETERGVILEEIGMYQDTPDDLCAERLFGAVFKGSTLGLPVLGKAATLNCFTGAFLRDYQKRHYCTENMVVSLAGSFDEAVVQEICARFGNLPKTAAAPYKEALYQPAYTLKRKTTEQNHLILAFPGLSFRAPQRFSLQLLSSIVGGGMSSRLFQEVREKRGLCYSVYSYGAGHDETGVFNVYTALNRDMEGEALQTICRVIREFVEKGPEKDELERAREQSKANVLMGMESTQSRMSHMGRSLLFTGEIMTADDIIEAYDAVTWEDVHTLSQEIFRFEKVSLSAVGKVSSREEYEGLLQQ